MLRLSMLVLNGVHMRRETEDERPHLDSLARTMLGVALLLVVLVVGMAIRVLVHAPF